MHLAKKGENYALLVFQILEAITNCSSLKKERPANAGLYLRNYGNVIVGNE
jgi:hypothetical protein